MQQILLFLIFIFCGAGSFFGQPSNLPLKKAWNFPSNRMSNFKVASDNVSKIILPQNDSKIITLDKSGQIIWEIELGGSLFSELVIFDNRLYFAIQPEDEKNKIKIRSVSLETGLTNWENLIENQVSIDSVNLQVSTKNLLLTINNKFLYSLSPNNGEVEIINELPFSVSSNIEVGIGNDLIYFANEKKQIIEYSLFKKSSRQILLLNNKINNLYFVNNKQLLLNDDLGKIYSYNIITGNKEWTFRTGGNIASIEKFNQELLIFSLDNYSYYITAKKGKLLWKKRMEGRIKGAIFKNNPQFVSSIINGQISIFSELSKGRNIDQIVLTDDSYFINKPIFLDNLLILSTNKGLTTYNFIK